MNPAKREEIFRRLQARNPAPTTELDFRTPFELLVAVVLSAQATDKSVNLATKRLFADGQHARRRSWRWARRDSRSTSRASACTAPRRRT